MASLYDASQPRVVQELIAQPIIANAKQGERNITAFAPQPVQARKGDLNPTARIPLEAGTVGTF